MTMGWFYLCFIYYSETVFYDSSPRITAVLEVVLPLRGQVSGRECQSLERDGAEPESFFYPEEANTRLILSTGNSICCCRHCSHRAGAMAEAGRKERLTSKTWWGGS